MNAGLHFNLPTPFVSVLQRESKAHHGGIDGAQGGGGLPGRGSGRGRGLCVGVLMEGGWGLARGASITRAHHVWPAGDAQP